jgi:chorismate synthase
LALKQLGVEVTAYTSQVGDIALAGNYTAYDLSQAESNAVRCPDAAVAAAMEQLILDVKREGDTIGGVVTCVVKGASVGLGEPLYDKLSASLASAMLSINAAKGFDYGNGFAAATGRGSLQNDIFYNDGDGVATRTNNSGGIQGGISNGNDIYFRVAFKPVATVLMEQPTVTKDGVETTLLSRGRHDPCVVPRAVPVVEAMAALVVLDHYMLDRARKELFS